MTTPFASSLIRIFRENAIVGTGFLVSDRHALTCAHVAADALGLERDKPESPVAALSLDFPFAAPTQRLRAKVARWRPMRSANDEQPNGDEDIALLEILDALPHGCHAAPLAIADAGVGADFYTFGFLADKGQPVEGRVKGSIVGGCVTIEDPQGKGYFIDEGFSGAPVWNQSQQAVIGMIVRRDYSAERTAYMVPASQLRQVRQAPDSPEPTTATLLYQVEPLPAAPESFHLHAWLWRSDKVERMTDPHQPDKKWHEVVEEIQLHTAVAYSEAADLAIELVLPRHEFGRDITQWERHAGGSLLQQLAVALRCQKRFAARRKQLAFEKNGMSRLQFLKQEFMHNRNVRLVLFDHWERNSLQLRRRASAAASDALFALAADHSPNHLNYELCVQNKGLFVACGFTPDSAEESALCIALDYGAPLAVWFRELPAGATLDETQLRATLRLEGVTLGALLRHLWELQREALAATDRTNPLYHLTVLHDDYERVPL